jgi:hypothetical protein
LIVAGRIALTAALVLLALFVYAWTLHRICGPAFDIFDGLWC